VPLRQGLANDHDATRVGGARFGLIVHHGDAESEYFYDQRSAFERLDKALDEVAQRGWIVVSMKND
jgi:hypothetical protein